MCCGGLDATWHKQLLLEAPSFVLMKSQVVDHFAGVNHFDQAKHWCMIVTEPHLVRLCCSMHSTHPYCRLTHLLPGGTCARGCRSQSPAQA